MALPRQIFPNTTYFVTRRTAQRTFLLRPSPGLNRMILYCLGHAAERYGIELHAFCFMSNHMHLVLTDPQGTLPRFMHWLNLFIAKCVNVMLSRWESVWTGGSYTAIVLQDETAVVEKIVYTLNNPVSAGLVRFGAQWPGCRSRPEDCGGRDTVIDRPKRFFTGKMPEQVLLRLTRPPCLHELDNLALAEYIDRHVREAEAFVHAEYDNTGRKFRGRKAVLAQSPFVSPRTIEPRRALRPRVACRDRWKRIAWLERSLEFLRDYREAWERFCNGLRDVVFPAGTYQMRLRFGVPCHDPPKQE